MRAKRGRSLERSRFRIDVSQKRALIPLSSHADQDRPSCLIVRLGKLKSQLQKYVRWIRWAPAMPLLGPMWQGERKVEAYRCQFVTPIAQEHWPRRRWVRRNPFQHGEMLKK